MAIAQFDVRLRSPFGITQQGRYAVAPEWWSDSAVGGPDMAQIRLDGHHETVAEGLKMLNWQVEILNSLGGLVWWGYVHAVDTHFGGVTIGLSLDDVYNAVAVAYVDTRADGTIERKTTAWAEDALSIARYGRREILLSATEGGQTAAQKYRDRYLSMTKIPVPTTRIGGGSEPASTLICRGYWHRLSRRYYTNLSGLEEFPLSGAGFHGIGNYYVNDTISFTAPDKINDSATPGGFSQLAEGDRFYVQNAAHTANNGWHTVQNITASQITTVGKGLVTASAGPNIAISATSPVGVGIAQAFQLTNGGSYAPWEAKRVAIQARRVGAVSDNLRIELRTNDAGNPSETILATADITGSTLSESMTWVEATLSTPVSISASTTYWLVVRRTGYNATEDGVWRLVQHYVVNLNENLGYANGAMKIAALGSWADRDPDAQMPFRVLGRVKTTTQMQTIVTDSELLGTDLGADSGIETWQYREGDRTQMDELQSLLNIGTDGGERLLAQVQPNRWVRVLEKPTAVKAQNLILSSDGKIRSSMRQDLEPGRLIAGSYVELEFLPVLDAVGPADRLFVERSRYDAATGQLTIESEGTESAWALGIAPG